MRGALILALIFITYAYVRALRRAREARRNAVMLEARALAAEERGGRCVAEAILNVRVVTITFTDGCIEQRHHLLPSQAELDAGSLKPGDYAGDGRRVTSVTIFQPFVRHT